MRAALLCVLLTSALLQSVANGSESPDLQSSHAAPKHRIVTRTLPWIAQPKWLSGAADGDSFRQKTNHDVARFEVDAPGRGMKWSANLSTPIKTEHYRFAAVRYRCRGERGWSDYTVCALGEKEYTQIIPPSVIQNDGRFHTVCVSLEDMAKKVPRIVGLGVQLQAKQKQAFLEIASVTFTNEQELEPLTDALPHAPGGVFEGFAAVPLTREIESVNTPANGSAWCRELGITSWFATPEITSEGIPFRLATGENNLLATRGERREEVAFDLGKATSEVYLLLVGHLTGDEEPAFGGGPFRHIRDVDRFRLQLEYEDGTIDECLPYNASTGDFGISRGLQVVAAAANSDKVLRRLVLTDSTTKGHSGLPPLPYENQAHRFFPR